MNAVEVRLTSSGRGPLPYQPNLGIHDNAQVELDMSNLQSRETSNFEANLLRANLQLLQNKVKSLQEENIVLATKNRQLEEDNSLLLDSLQRQEQLKGNSLHLHGSIPHMKSYDALDTPSFNRSTYSSTTPSTRTSAMMYSQYADEVGVYNDSLRAPVWKDMSPPLQEGESPNNCEGEHGIPSSHHRDLNEDPLPLAGLSQEGCYGDKCPQSTTAIGGSNMYINSLLKSPSPPPPEAISRRSSTRMTLPLNYNNKRASVEVKRSRSFRDSRRHKWTRSSDAPSISPSIASMLNTVSTPVSNTNSTSLNRTLPSANNSTVTSKPAKSPRRQNKRSFMFCFSRPLTND